MKLICVNLLVIFLICTFLMESTSAEDEMRMTAGDCFEVNTAYPHNDINPSTALTTDVRTSPLECQALCKQTKGCQYFTWRINECWLKNKGGVGVAVLSVGAVSGLKICGNCNEPNCWSEAMDKKFRNSQCPNIGHSKESSWSSSAEACKMKCQETLNCNAINYNSNKECVLRACDFPVPGPSGYGWKVWKGYFITGSGDGWECWKESNTDTYGFDMESKEVKSENECADWCGTTRGCTFWTWRKRDNFCWIKNGHFYTLKRPGFTSGSKVCASEETMKLPKDGNWNLLFRQTLNGEDDLFKYDEWSRNKENVDAPNFSRLEDFEKFRRPDGTFHLFLWYPELGEGNEWTQTSNPVTKTSRLVDNYKAISISYNGWNWGGLEHNNGRQGALLDGSVTGHWWYWGYAIGATRLQGGGIPGPGDDKGNRVVQSVELYIDY